MQAYIMFPAKPLLRITSSSISSHRLTSHHHLITHPCFFVLSACACFRALKIRSLHLPPLHLYRLAVFSIKPTLPLSSSNNKKGKGVAMCTAIDAAAPSCWQAVVRDDCDGIWVGPIFLCVLFSSCGHLDFHPCGKSVSVSPPSFSLYTNQRLSL